MEHSNIIVNGNKVQHWLNGQMTVEYERGTPQWRDLVATSKFKDSPGFGEVRGRKDSSPGSWECRIVQEY